MRLLSVVLLLSIYTCLVVTLAAVYTLSVIFSYARPPACLPAPPPTPLHFVAATIAACRSTSSSITALACHLSPRTLVYNWPV
ncbi:hypothetical protein V8D89_004093 [Ganoderma adspersum]